VSRDNVKRNLSPVQRTQNAFGGFNLIFYGFPIVCCGSFRKTHCFVSKRPGLRFGSFAD
jgi:hypothetical protein